ncbi:DUF2975 domain-containing protein [Clostridium septicum]|uniref:DUF2975 domain-containing protein n=1 Tax=Clostridium septicum TaxID=1504 RepID=A0A9N7PMK2_CLOSE|nr:DUF2975 domain-containing protein [Clostridium septicum]AYE35222.1 DUF2975 domain-containing protein [Clostridium septicum]QAS60617.1 DUF2975 domain-containing protein [Clostridium septicum]UEC20127.1 DUF2975 domain-containing protein [Clostridium septicum]USS01816.1 DUF2975 domain-containing protein [Clostridium septicum]WLF70389.1 DUF2975 domain-containing protein [Clostridium septicum]
MKFYGEKSLSQILKITLNIAIIFGIVMTGDVFYNTFFNREKSLNTNEKVVFVTLLIIGIISLFLIVLELRKIIGTLIESNPFVRENVVSFKKISVESFIIAGCYITNLIFNSNFKNFKFIYVDNSGIHTDMEFLIFLFAGIFIFILAKVFEKAVEFKEENDFTI